MSPSHYDAYEEAMRDFLYMDSPEVLRLIAAVYCIHHFKGVPPVWLFLIAPSSSAKTEFLKPLSLSKFVADLSQLTSKTLVSGFAPSKNKNAPKAGLLDRITAKARASGEDPMIVIKDFTTILNMRAEERAMVMSQLREVKDGKLSGEYGNGVTSLWTGRMGLIAAVTDQIEEAIADSAKFGDRYVYYRMEVIDPEKAIERMIKNRTRDTGAIIEKAHVHLDALAKDSFTSFREYGPVPPRDLIITGGKINALAILATKLRTPVIRDAYRREIMNVYPAESPTRHVSHLTSLVSGLMATRGGIWDEIDYPLLRKLALGSAPVIKLRLAEALFKSAVLSTKECADALNLPKSAVRYPLDDLFAAGLLHRKDPEKLDSDSYGVDRPYIYSLTADTRGLMLRAGYSKEDMPHELALAFDGKEVPNN
jgi:DNA-binding transcriptional ArsR family regulator